VPQGTKAAHGPKLDPIAPFTQSRRMLFDSLPIIAAALVSALRVRLA
jgi:hypothetical protein